MMNTPVKILLSLIALGSISGAAYYLLSGSADDSAFGMGEDGLIDAMEGDEPSSGEQAEGDEENRPHEGPGRESFSTKLDERTGGTSLTVKVKLQVEGRVLTKDGRPVQDAKVDVFARKSFDMGRAMRRGNWQEVMRSPEARNFTNRRGDYQPKKIGDALRTDADGRFSLDAKTFSSSVVELTVQHEVYAPVVVNREWREEQGKLVLDKIEVETGGKIMGRVLSKRGTPVSKAKIIFDPRNRGRRRRGRGMGRSSNERLKELLGKLETNEMGQFLIANAPPGDFSISVDAEDFIPGRSKNLELKPGATLDTGILYLERGAVLSGVVRNQKGKVVKEAQVSAQVSQAYVRTKLAKLLKARGLGNIDNVWRNQKARSDPEVSYLLGLMNRSGWGGRGRGMGFGRGNRNQNEVRTDEQGKYKLTQLPHAPLEVSVRHSSYLDEDKKGIDPDTTPRLDILVEKRLSLQGVVLNAATGEGLVSYGIRARKIQARDLPESVRLVMGLSTSNSPTPRDRGRDPRSGRNNNRGRQSANKPAAGNRKGGKKQGAKRKKSNQPPRQLSPAQLRRKAQKENRQAEQRARKAAAEQKKKLVQDRRNAERLARLQQRDRLRLQSFGNSGIPFRGSSKITKHAGGAFSLDQLNPGLYVLDIQAEGFRKIAAGPYKLTKGMQAPTIQVRLQRGRVIEGLVTTRQHKPIVGAEVELLIPPPTQVQASANQENFMASLFRRGQNNGTRLVRVRTGKSGKFLIEGQGDGNYRLIVRAEGFASYVQKTIQVSGRDLKGIKVGLARACKISGKVHNLPSEETVTVTINGDNGTRRFVRVDAKTGKYSEGDLDPGRYLVRIMKGRNFMGGVMSALSQPGGIQPNVILGEGDHRNFDLNAGAEELGKIQGMVYINGNPVAGLSLQIEPIEGQGSIEKKTLQGMGRLRRFLGRAFRARTDKEGKYRLDNIPPGNYDLSIKKRIKGGEKVIHKEIARVAVGGPQRLNYSLLLGRLEITVKDQNGKKVNRSRMILALSSETAGLPPKEWRKLPSFQRADIRGARLVLRDLKTGEYQYYITGRQLSPRQDRLFVAAPPAPSQIQILVNKKAPKKKPAANKLSTNVAPGSKK